jgi:hypothetical protein
MKGKKMKGKKMKITPADFWPKEDWQYDVANGDTKLGYEEWLEHQEESNPDWLKDYLNYSERGA